VAFRPVFGHRANDRKCDMKRTNYDLSHLIKPLTAAAAVAPNSDSYGYELTVLIHHLSRDAEKQEHPIAKFISLITNEPRLEQFNGRMVVTEQGSVRVDYSTLVEWLINHTCKVGAEQALVDLVRYIETDKIPIDRAVAVGGINVVGQNDLGEGLRLIPFDEFPDCNDKRFLAERSTHGMQWATAMLLKSAETKRHHILVEELASQQHNLLHLANYQDLDDALLCLGLFGPTAPHPLAKWILLPDWAFTPGGAYSIPYVGEFKSPRKMPDDAPNLTKQLLTLWNILSDSQRAELRLAMQRLNSAMRRTSLVDSAIDLGIALESIFLNDQNSDRGELAFRLRVRAARWLGHNSTERNKIAMTMNDLYNCRSKAVHTGRVPNEVRKRQTKEILEEGYRYAATAIIRLIKEGKPNWDAITYD